MDGIGYLIVFFAGHFETVPTIATTFVPIIRACSILQSKDITEFENGHIDRAFGAVHDRDLECIVVLVNLCAVKFDLGSDVFVELSDHHFSTEHRIVEELAFTKHSSEFAFHFDHCTSPHIDCSKLFSATV